VALLVLLLGSSLAGSQEQFSLVRQPVPRSLYLSTDPRSSVPELFVAARKVTTLRFEVPCDPAQTKLLSGDGLFEPLLVGGRSVVIVPLRELAPEDRFLLQVTLVDGTSLPFVVTAARHRVDGQVDVFPDPESPQALRTRLEEKQEENHVLRAANDRYLQEETSVDHALAALLASGKASLTPFKEVQKWRLREEGMLVDINLFDGSGRAAIVFDVSNLDPQRVWKLEEARLASTSTWEEKPFALRSSAASIASGKTGRIAIVIDMASFSSKKGPDQLVLELFRDGGLRQVCVLLELDAAGTRVSSSNKK
jgi:uncharacterized protein (TIGR02268 family)